VLDTLLPSLHAAVKRSARARRILAPTVRTAARAGARIRQPFAAACRPPSRVHHAFEDWLEVDGPNGASLKEIHDPLPADRTLPFSPDGRTHWKFERHRRRPRRATHVAVLPGGRTWGAGSAVITADDALLAPLSLAVGDTEEYLAEPERHPIFAERRLPPATRLDGVATLLSAPGGGGYYHWLIDLLPRLRLLEEAGMPVDASDHVIVNATSARYQRETLARLGVSGDRIVESRWHPHIRAERLVVPSLPGDFGHAPRWACDFLRDAFLPAEGVEDAGALLYLNRTHVTHRRVTNEAEFIARLQTLGFENPALERLPVAEQARRMAAARVVVAPHGAALTNLVFCRPGTRVIELLSPSDVSHVYWTLADTMGLDYAFLLAEGLEPPIGEDPHEATLDMSIDIDTACHLVDRKLRESRDARDVGSA